MKQLLTRHADLSLVVGVIAILLILFAPIPPAFLDLCIIVNFAFGLTILLLTFYVARPVEFSTFPSLLLVATLFRLSLNIAATRLILANGEAGQVIAAIGSFVVQGNFVIGLVVFFILVVVQYVVVTSGAQRVSEVAARFVLDAMPGQQMSIDADLNMGLIDQDEAKRRRKELEKEAAFYGSMDGASKFVKGDAIAGIVILLIDILGGWAVGVLQMGMPWIEALQTFTLLTIGDGIVTQVPALIISVATGIIVTRSSADSQLGLEVLKQLGRFPKIQWLVGIALTGLLAMPGMPKWPVALLIIGLLVSRFLKTSRTNKQEEHQDAQEQLSEAPLPIEPPVPAAIEIMLGKKLADAWAPAPSTVGERITALRKQFSAETGLAIPPMQVHSANTVAPLSYMIMIHGSRFGESSIHPDRRLAIRTSEKGDAIPGISAKDPAFGLPAVWIEESQTERAAARGYTLVDPLTVLVTHATEVIRNNTQLLLGRSEVVRLLEGVRARQPGLVEELIPAIMSASDVQKVLQNLLAEHVSIRNMDLIAEVLVDAGRQQKDTFVLTELVRQKLGYSICETLAAGQTALSVLTLDPTLESTISQNIRSAGNAGAFVLDPRAAERFLSRLLSQADAMMRQNLRPVLLCNGEVRRHIKSFSRRMVPRLAVVSVAEIPHSIDLKSFSVINVDN